jgi:hypothetical protein
MNWGHGVYEKFEYGFWKHQHKVTYRQDVEALLLTMPVRFYPCKRYE